MYTRFFRMPLRGSRPLAGMAAAAGLLLTVPPAQAARGVPLFFQSGDILYPVAPLPAEYGSPPVMLGYMCQHFDVMGANVWTDGCHLVAIPEENTVARLPVDVEDRLLHDPRFSFDHAQRGWWHRYAFWVPVGTVGALLVAVMSLLVLAELFASLGRTFAAIGRLRDRLLRVRRPGDLEPGAPVVSSGVDTHPVAAVHVPPCQ